MDNIEQIINDLTEVICNEPNSIVPVIGEREFFFRDENGDMLPLQKEVVRHFFQRYQRELSYDTEERLSSSGYFGLTLLQKEFPSQFRSDLREAVLSRINQVTVSNSLKKFLLASEPRVVITTTPFDILERILPNYRSIYFDGEADMASRAEIRENERVIFHLFGKAGRFSRKWVSNENDLLEFLHALHDSDLRPVGLSNYLKEKGTLFLGCDFPDWIFRFLWYSFSIEKPDKFNPENTTGYWLNGRSYDSAFDNFLQGIKCQPQHTVNLILESVANKLPANSSSDEYDVFLSHAGPDAKPVENSVVSRVKSFLESHGLRVWISEDHCPNGGNYVDAYHEGIRKSNYFMPVVTSEYCTRFTDMWLASHQETYLVEETDYAIEYYKKEMKGKKVFFLPLIVEGASLYGKELNEETINQFASGRKPVLPPDVFYNMQCYFYCLTSGGRDTFSSHNWSLLKSERR